MQARRNFASVGSNFATILPCSSHHLLFFLLEFLNFCAKKPDFIVLLVRFSPNNEHDDANTIKNDDVGGGGGDALLLLRNSHISKNVNLLMGLGAGDVLVDVCGSPRYGHYHVNLK